MKNSKIQHIVLVTSEFPPLPGGIGNHAYHLALYLSKYNYEVTVVADQRTHIDQSEKDFDLSLPFLVKRIPLKNFRALMYVNRIIVTFRLIKNGDFVIATGKFSLWNVALCTYVLKCPNMAIVHGSEVNFRSPLLRTAINKALKRFDRIVAVSQYTKELMAHLKKHVEVIPNGIDASAWTTNYDPLPLKGDPILTTVGRVSFRKGQLMMIKLLPSLIDDYPDAHYHCIGILGEADDFTKKAKALGVESHITFHGVLNDANLKRALAATDVFVMLSQESPSGDVEGFGIAVLESNAMGVPAIGAKNCGIEDAIDDGITGFLIDGNDRQAFKQSVSLLLKQKQIFKENSKKWAELHDWNKLIKRYITLISWEV